MHRSLIVRLLPVLFVAGAASAQAPFDVERIFREVDTDRDGFITAAEARAGVVDDFRALDANGDGALDRSEVRRDLLRHGGGSLPPAMLEKAVADTFALYNADGRGDATLADYQTAQQALMMGADADGDGRVSLAEKRALHGAGPAPAR